MKRIVCIFLMTLAILPATMFAQTDVWDGSAAEWEQGSGTESDPYLIETAENLAWIAEMVNSGVTTYTGVYFKLVSNLNMNSIAWVPIGNSETQSFCGQFDGNNKYINNIKITGSYTYQGLFGITGQGFQCVNLGVNSTISSTGQYCGGIVGYIKGNNTVIENCYHIGSVSSTYSSSFSGGIVGYIGASSTSVLVCYNAGLVSSSYIAGGIVGNVGSTSISVSDCHNTGYVTSSSSNSYFPSSGGIVGYVNGSSTGIVNCYNTGDVSATISRGSGSVSASAYSGGILGCNISTTTLRKCYNKGTVTTTSHTLYSNNSNKHSYSGGLVGINKNNTITITYSYNKGWVKAYSHYGDNNTVEGTRQVGGLIGYIDNTSASITNCYNTGTLTGGTLGGIRGNTTGTVSNCYYLETCGGTVAGGTSKTEAAMKSTSFPVLLNANGTVFVMDVTPNVNDGYPIFGSDIIAITTKAATNRNFTSVTLNGIYETQPSWPGGEADVVGFEYKKTTDANYTTVYTNVGTPASYNLPGLQSGTNYQYRMFVQKDGVTYYGNIVTFSTLQCNVTVEVQTASTSICAGDTATLTAAATSTLSDTFTYLWSTQDTAAAITTTEAGTYTVTVTDGNGCTATANATITVNPLPVGTISGNTALCAGQSTTLTASGANRYNWSTGASAPTITVSEGGTYVCTFTNSYNCSSTQSVEVSMFSSPVITGETAFCTGGSTTLTATGGTSYTWSTGATTPTITVSQPGTYSVTGSSVGGCTGSSSVTVVENPLPTVEISGYPVICSGIGAELTATEGSSYLWSTGEDTRSITANYTGNFSVLVTDVNGCSNTTSVEVTALPGVSISGNTNICQGESTTLSVEMDGSYLWSTGAQTALITVSDAGYYSVTVSLPNGCSASATANVSINPQPVPTISGNTTICQGETTTLTANWGVSYRWSTNATAASISVGTSGLYSVTVTNAQGCSASTFTNVTVNPLPTVTISGNTSTCQGSTTTLTANGAQSYQWNTGSTNATISVGAAGNFTVTGYSAAGCSNTASAFVTIYPTYNTPVSHAMCQGETYNFFGQNLTNAGTYSHTLYTQNGCDSIITLTLTVRDLPVPTISGNTTICQGETTTLVATGGTSYQWSAMGQGNSITVTEAGTYTVTATNAQGCSATASTYVTVNPLPNITISGNTAVCQGNTTTLVANGAQSYQWNTGSTNAAISVGSAGNFIVTGYSAQGCTSSNSVYVQIYPTYNTPVSHSICQGETYNFFGLNLTNAGTYSHTLYTQNGCDSIITLTLTVRDLPVVTINGNTTICQGETATLVATGGTSYQWSAMGQGNSITVTEAGTYTVTATNAQGCSATASTYVTVNPLPNITISGNTAVCQGNTTTLVANGAATYQWSNGVSGAVNTIGTFGIYTVTGISAEGCSNTASATVVVYQLPVLNISGDTQLCSGETTTLTANGAATYLWNNGTTDAALTTGAAGTYTVIGTDEHGCYSTASIDVAVNYPSSTEVTVVECDSYEWQGITRTESGDYTWTGQTAAGCDSIITLHLTINESVTTEMSETANNSYEWHGTTYTESGDYTWTGQTANGCDSTVTLHLTITTGVNEWGDGHFTVYPNPTTGMVNVRLDENGATWNVAEIQMFDVYGRLLNTVETCHGASLQTMQIDLSSYAPGVYLIQLVGDGRVVGVRKVVRR